MSEGRELGGAQTQAEVRRRGTDYVILPRPDSSTGSRVRGCQLSSTRSSAPVVPAIPAPTPATAQLPPEYGLRQPRYPQVGRGCAAFRQSRLGPSVLSAFAGPIHGFSSADRPLTSRLLMVVMCVLCLSCYGTWASPGISLKRRSSAPPPFLEFHNSRHFSLCGSLSVRHLLAL